MNCAKLFKSASIASFISLSACSQSEDTETHSSANASAMPGEDSEASAEEGSTNASETGDGADTADTAQTTDPTEDGGFVNADAAGPGCGEECDIWNADDCPAGEKCAAVGCEVGANSWDSNVCREVQGSAAVGDECMSTDGSAISGNDTCDKGSMCWNPDLDTGIGACVAFCGGSPDAPVCAAGSSCANWSALILCLPSCDPLAQDCELASDLCVPNPAGDGYTCTLDASGDMAPYGTPCNYNNVCNPGLMCLGAAGVPEPECAAAAGCCSPMCSITASEPCPGAGQTCEAIFDPQPPGYEDVGVCTIAT